MTMLHWLAGKQPPEEPTDFPGCVEPPDTPAPVFAVRAFKHAIFGTPQTVQPKAPRRNSNTEHTRPRVRQPEPRPVRPTVQRPKSASDAGALFRDLPDPPSSPSKGILLTPGTTRAERKTVTFGDAVLDNEEKRPMQSGLPDDFPGKFPSPWSKPTTTEILPGGLAEKSGGKTSLTAKFEQVRDDTTRRRSKSHRASKSLDEGLNEFHEFAEPQTECGRYWKAQFDVYRENTQREVRKLVMKQKAAKDFARDRDQRCAEMEDQLRVEKEKVAKLERLAAELESRLKPSIAKSSESEQTRKEPTEQRPGRTGVAAGQSKISTALDAEDRKLDLTAGLNRRMDALRSTRDTAPIAENSTSKSPERASSPVGSDRIAAADSGRPVSTTMKTDVRETNPITHQDRQRLRSRPETINGQPRDDMWTVASSSARATHSSGRSKAPPHHEQKISAFAEPSPLTSVNINTLPPNGLLRRDSTQTTPPEMPAAEAAKGEFPLREAPATAFSSGTLESKPQRLPARGKAATVTTESEEQLNQAYLSSSFEINAPLMSPPLSGPKSPMFEEHPTSRAEPMVNAKENARPTAAWSSINAPAAGRRVTSNMVGKDGKEVSADRLQAARDRLLKKGRNVS